jgi:queuine tRNA-ribosyltransferase/7-cyano-7-deazaguanine tRNA-ribosyltransferase
MIEFKILKKSKKSKARIGLLKTEHGTVETPALVPVATQAVVKTLTSEEVKETKTQILICNSFYLHLRPGEAVIEKSGGLHKFMNWSGPLMTDSGGFQVFSWGFGRDFGVGKVLKAKKKEKIVLGQNPKSIKVEKDGVWFFSPFDGKKIFWRPEDSIRIQEKLGPDIIFTFDECTPPLADYQYTKKSLLKTHAWAKICLKEKKSKQALFGIVQGGKYEGLRRESAKFIGSLPFDGFGIGGEFGQNKKRMKRMVELVNSFLPPEKPRHLLGIGYLEDISLLVESGCDLFDCNVPTHYARRGIAFTSEGKIDLTKKIFLRKKEPLDKKCSCFVCQNYRQNYICHLLRVKEITAFKLLTFHNLYFFNSYLEKIRQKIKNE